MTTGDDAIFRRISSRISSQAEAASLDFSIPGLAQAGGSQRMSVARSASRSGFPLHLLLTLLLVVMTLSPPRVSVVLGPQGKRQDPASAHLQVRLREPLERLIAEFRQQASND